MNKFTIGSQWKTRGGWRAVVVDNDGLFIAVWHKTERESYLHYKDGMLQSNCPGNLDLIEPWVEPKEYDVWVNVHMGPSTIITSAWTKKEDADKFGTDDRIACVNVKFKEGDGL